jgi:hypothetical protein
MTVSWRLLVAGWFGWCATASASCGLDHCPLPEQQLLLGDGLPRSSLYLRTRFTAFDILGIQGTHSDVILGGAYRGVRRLQLGGNLSLVSLAIQKRRQPVGLSNPVVFGEWQAASWGVVSVGMGLQVEIPVGFGSEFVADSHTLVLPYGTIHVDTSPVFVHLQLGYAQVVEGASSGGRGHSHSSLVVVDPHEQGELVYRTAIGFKFANTGVVPLFTVNGQQVVIGEAPSHFLYVGGRVGARVASRLSLNGSAEVPVSAGRYAGRGGVRITVDL